MKIKSVLFELSYILGFHLQKDIFIVKLRIYSLQFDLPLFW